MAQNVNVRVTGGTPAMAQQRYFNKASGRMETAKQMHGYTRPVAHPVPSGHQVAATKHTVVAHPAPAPPRSEPDLVHMTRPQLFDLAHKLVGQEQQAGRLPFEQQENRLAGGEQATRQNTERLATQGNQAGASLVANQQAAGQAGEQRAREAQTQAVMPTEARQANEAHGVAPTEQGSRQEALLKALGQGGVNQAANARAAGEKWAQSQASAYQQSGTAAVQAVGTRFGNERSKNREAMESYLAKGAGQESKLRLDLLSEQGKLKEAAQANKLRAVELGVKTQQNEAKNELTARGQNVTARGQGLTHEAAERRNAAMEKNNAEARALQKRGQDLTRASATERTAATREHTHIYAEVQNMTHGGTKPSRAAGLKYQGLLDTAYGYARALKAEGKKPSEVEAAMRIGEGTGKGGEEGVGYSPDVIRAAINLVKYDRLGPNDKKVAAGYGLKPELGHPEWFKTGEKKPTPQKGLHSPAHRGR